MGKFLGASDDDSMDEESMPQKKANPALPGKRIRIRKPKSLRLGNVLPNAKNVVSGSNLLEQTKLKIRNSMNLKNLSKKAEPSVYKEYQERQREELKAKLSKHKKLKDQVMEKSNLSKGQRKREKKKSYAMKKKNFVEFLQQEVSQGKGQFEKRDKEGVFNLGGMGGALGDIGKDDVILKNDAKFGGLGCPAPGAKKDAGGSDMGEIVRVSNIMKMKQFSSNPLAVLRTHITNTLKMENKF